MLHYINELMTVPSVPRGGEEKRRGHKQNHYHKPKQRDTQRI